MFNWVLYVLCVFLSSYEYLKGVEASVCVYSSLMPRARVCISRSMFHVSVCGYLKQPPSVSERHHSPAPDTSRWGDRAAASASLRLPLSG